MSQAYEIFYDDEWHLITGEDTLERALAIAGGMLKSDRSEIRIRKVNVSVTVTPSGRATS